MMLGNFGFIPTTPIRLRSPATRRQDRHKFDVAWLCRLFGGRFDAIVEQQNNGTLWLYTYSATDGALSGQDVGAVGGNFHVVGFGPLGTAGQDEMLMQDAAGGSRCTSIMPARTPSSAPRWVRSARPGSSTALRPIRRAEAALPSAPRPHSSYRQWRRWEVGPRSALRAVLRLVHNRRSQPFSRRRSLLDRGLAGPCSDNGRSASRSGNRAAAT